MAGGVTGVVAGGDRTGGEVVTGALTVGVVTRGGAPMVGSSGS